MKDALHLTLKEGVPMLQNPLWLNLGMGIAVGALLVAAWYWVCLRLNRKRSSRILQWINEALAGYGRVAGVEWDSPSRFHVRLRLGDSCFRSPRITIRLSPREMPVLWLAAKWKKQDETATFEANLPCAPSFSMQVQNQRWFGKSNKQQTENVQGYRTERLGPFVITSRRDWQQDIIRVMESLSSTHQYGFTHVAFSKSVPHFSATVPLRMIRPEPEMAVGIFDLLRELATGPSTSRL